MKIIANSTWPHIRFEKDEEETSFDEYEKDYLARINQTDLTVKFAEQQTEQSHLTEALMRQNFRDFQESIG